MYQSQFVGKLNRATNHSRKKEEDYVVYIFTIEEADGVITKQYYIVKDHVTNFSGTEDVFEAVQGIADSFVWADDSLNEE